MWKRDPHFLNPDISGSYVEIVISYLISYHMFVGQYLLGIDFPGVVVSSRRGVSSRAPKVFKRSLQDWSFTVHVCACS
jgi:hypothetical protein